MDGQLGQKDLQDIIEPAGLSIRPEGKEQSFKLVEDQERALLLDQASESLTLFSRRARARVVRIEPPGSERDELVRGCRNVGLVNRPREAPTENLRCTPEILGPEFFQKGID